MALALFLRNVPKTKACPVITQHLLKRAPLISTSSQNICQLSLQNKNWAALYTRNNIGILNISNPYLACRTISFSEPRKAAAVHDHSKHWTLEKLLSITLLTLAPLTFAYPNFIFDNAFAVATVIHLHWGLDACIVDYLRPIVVGTILSKLAWVALYIVSATTLGGLLYLNINDIGIGKTFRKFWSIKH